MSADAESKPPSHSVSPEPTLGQQALRGLGWSVAGSLGSKFSQLGGQIVLAWLLLPEHFGLVGLAYTVIAFANVVGQSGVRVILVQRHAQMRRWATAAFWMSLSIGVVQALIMISAAPLAAMLYEEPDVAGLIIVLALAAPLQAVQAIPAAKLQSDLRFKVLAAGGMATTIGTMGLTVVCALLGFGAYSFAVPVPLVAAASLVANWLISRPPVRMHLHLWRWRYLLGDNSKLIASNLILTVTAQGDYVVLGAMYPAAAVGIYYFAYRLTAQSMSLLTSNLNAVIFPALTRIAGPDDQSRAFLRGARLLAAVAVPFAAVHAALADPLVRLLFEDKWLGAIPLVQILSVAMAFRLVGSPAGSLMQAQGRFGLMVVLYAGYAIVFITAISIAAWLGGVVTVACAAALYFAVVVGVLHPWLVTRRSGGSFADILMIHSRPTLAALVGVGGSAALAALIPVFPGRELAQAVTVVAIGLPAYGVLLWMLDPDLVQDLWRRVRHLGPVPRRRTTSLEASQ